MNRHATPAAVEPRVYAVLEVPTVLPAELNPNARDWNFRRQRHARQQLEEQVLADARNLVRSSPPLAGVGTWPLEVAEVDVRYLVHAPSRNLVEAYRPEDNDNAATAGSKAVLDALVGAGVLVGDRAEHVPWSPRWRVERVVPGERERLVIIVREPFGF